jgi:phosphonatase-like hydrolase
MIKMVVFDMAGTTVDEGNVVYKTLRDALNANGFDFDLNTVLAIGAGQEKRQAISDLAKSVKPEFPESSIDQVFDDFKDRLTIAYQNLQVKAQPGAEDVFSFLKNNAVKVVLNTGYDRDTAEGLLQKLGWQEGKEIDLLVTASDVRGSRPAPDMIDFAREKFHVPDPKMVAKVGDSVIDIEEGQNADCGLSIGITTGAHTAAQLQSAAPHHVIDHLSELPSLLA